MKSIRAQKSSDNVIADSLKEMGVDERLDELGRGAGRGSGDKRYRSFDFKMSNDPVYVKSFV